MLMDWEWMPEKAEATYIIVKDVEPCKVGALDTENSPDGKIGEWSIAYRSPTDNALCVCPYSGRRDKITFPELTAFHNFKWDARVLRHNKMPVPENFVDTMVAAYTLGLGRQDVKDTGRSGDKMVGGLGLKYLARRHLGFEMNTWNEMKNRPPEEMAEYNAKDSVATLLLWEKFKPQLPQHFWDIDMPLLPVLMAMEDRGILVDPDFLKQYAESLNNQLAEIDLPLNPFSPKQVVDYVYGTLGLEPSQFTPTGQPSTESEVLETIDDPIIKGILRYRELYKEKKTYVSSYQARMDLESRIHCDFKQTSTATGRLSSARPNLQNVTIHSEDSRLRELFIAPEGKKLVRVDWQQLELRVFAALTLESRLLRVFEEGRDPHQETADFLGIDRAEGRNVNFLMLYGGGAWKISQEFGVPIDRAKTMISQYYKAYPGILKYHREMIEIAHAEKKVTNWFGRTRRLDSMYSEHWKTVKEGEREAINTPIQSTAAEIVKVAMIDLHFSYDAPLLLQVHDELILELDEKVAEEYAQWLREYLPTLIEINGLTFPVDVGVGNNWKESKENAK